MSLAPGTKLGPYEILAPIGAGGMGEVYRAKDTKLKREVALKVLPDSFANDPERMARFQREAQVLASLNHPNIAAIHGLEESDGTRALVMELVKGEPLKGPVLLETALDYARQIADALEAAHEKGIVHRDLKPGNIMVTAGGVVKVLDFGLAKAGEDPSSNPEHSPTLTISPTRAGLILGTAPYMAPEQARGKAVDKRADIWAFGCVLYEMLSGRQAFTGETTTDILAAVVMKEPDLRQLPVEARRLIESCLKKDPKQRLQAIGDWRLLLENKVTPAVSQRSTLWVAGTVVFALIAAFAGALLWRATRPIDHPLTRLNLDLGPDAVPGLNLTVAISSDGRRLVYYVRGPNAYPQLATRLLDQNQVTLLPETGNARDPFLSPDGQWIGFFLTGQLKKVSVQGGPANLIANITSLGVGAAWSPDGNIVFTPGTGLPLFRVPAEGGKLEPLSQLGQGEVSHRWPQTLPDADSVLYTASRSGAGMQNADIQVVSTRTRHAKTLLHDGYYARYLPSGHLAYLRQGTLYGVKFDLKRLEVVGSPVPLLDDVASNPVAGGGQFDFSNNGTFVYMAGKSAAESWQLAWLDSSGKTQPVIGEPGAYNYPRLSPDGKKLLFVGSDAGVYVYDLAREVRSRLTNGEADLPIWAPDSKHIIFASGASFLWTRSDGAGSPHQLLESRRSPRPWSISADGRWLAYFERGPDNEWDIWTLPLDLTVSDDPKPGKPKLFLRSQYYQYVPEFSPDGKWIAYRSNESGRFEVYVRPFPEAESGKCQISTGGGLYPLWSKNMRELFYENTENQIMVVDYTVNGSSFIPGKPRLWSDKRLFYTGISNVDLALDGKRFLIMSLPESPPGEKAPVHVTVLQNFFDEVKRRIP